MEIGYASVWRPDFLQNRARAQVFIALLAINLVAIQRKNVPRTPTWYRDAFDCQP